MGFRLAAYAVCIEKGQVLLACHVVAAASDRTLRARERGEAGQDTVDPDLVAT
ncbi:hypothetical protein ACIBG0_15425 [Nocardia sp. NPDC050630]|uniref:hypothetical protein n=1 Tax=Nocardia sp. NPDC050630 TaxID=3364321 RepID=UPI00378E8ADC